MLKDGTWRNVWYKVWLRHLGHMVFSRFHRKHEMRGFCVRFWWVNTIQQFTKCWIDSGGTVLHTNQTAKQVAKTGPEPFSCVSIGSHYQIKELLWISEMSKKWPWWKVLACELWEAKQLNSNWFQRWLFFFAPASWHFQWRWTAAPFIAIGSYGRERGRLYQSLSWRALVSLQTNLTSLVEFRNDG